MGDRFKKTQAGQPLDVSAEVWNSFLDTVRDRKSKNHDQLSGAIETIRNADLVRIKNNSGEDRDQFQLLALDQPIIRPVDNLREFKNQPTAVGVTPVHPDYFGRFAVLLDPLRDGKIGRAWVSGVCPALVNVTDTCHEFADIKDGDATQLESQPFGSAQILWREGGTGTQWAVVRLGNINSDMRRFKLVESLNRCGSAAAVRVNYNSITQSWCDVDCGFTVYDSLGIVETATAGMFGWSKWLPDSQKWEVVQLGEGCCSSSGSSGSSGSTPSGSSSSGSTSYPSSSSSYASSSGHSSSSYSSSESSPSSSGSSGSSGSEPSSSGSSGSGSSSGESCVTIYETDVLCEYDKLNVYTRAVSICISNCQLTRYEGSWIFSHQAGCCGCGCSSGSGSSSSGSSSWSSSYSSGGSNSGSGSGSSGSSGSSINHTEI